MPNRASIVERTRPIRRARKRTILASGISFYRFALFFSLSETLTSRNRPTVVRPTMRRLGDVTCRK